MLFLVDVLQFVLISVRWTFDAYVIACFRGGTTWSGRMAPVQQLSVYRVSQNGLSMSILMLKTARYDELKW